MSTIEVQCPGQIMLAEASQVVKEQKRLFDVVYNSSDLLCLFYPSVLANWRAFLLLFVGFFFSSYITSCNLLLPYLVLIRTGGQTQKKFIKSSLIQSNLSQTKLLN